MIRDMGYVEPGTTLYIPFHTFDSNDPSASVTLTGLATTDIEIYKDGSTTQRASDNGYALLDTDGIDFDGITGIHGISINLADNSTAGFYAAGSQYWVVISSVTVDAATVNFVLATFRIGYQGAHLNTTIASLSSQTSFTLTNGPAEDDALNGSMVLIHDVASAVQKGYAVVSDYTGSTKTVTLLAGTTFTAAATDNIAFYPPVNMAYIASAAVSPSSAQIGVNVIQAAGTAWNSGAIGAATLAADTITAAKVADGTIDAATFAAGAINAAAIASDAITDAKVASDVTIASVTGAVGSVTGNVGGNVTGSVGSVAAGGITSSSFASGAITATAIATDAIGSAEIADGAFTAAKFASDCITAAKIADGAIDAATFAAGAINAAAIASDAITDAKVASDVTIASVTGAVGSVTGNVGGNVTGSVGSVASGGITSGSFAAGAITASAIATDAIGAAELASDAIAEIADQVWDEVLSGHAGVGSAGAALSAAGGSGDPWSTALPGAYSSGTAGHTIGTYLTGNSYTRLGSPAGASVSADIAAMKVDTAAILDDTGTSGVVVVSGSKTGYSLATTGMDSVTLPANIITASSIASNAITAAKVATDAIGAAQLASDAIAEINATVDTALADYDAPTKAELDTAVSALATASALSTVSTNVSTAVTQTTAASLRTAVGLASANLDTQLGDLPTAVENADALLGRNVAGGSSSGRLVKEALYFLRNKWTVSGGTLTVYATDDTTSAWTSTVSTDDTAEPVTGSDPS